MFTKREMSLSYSEFSGDTFLNWFWTKEFDVCRWILLVSDGIKLVGLWLSGNEVDELELIRGFMGFDEKIEDETADACEVFASVMRSETVELLEDGTDDGFWRIDELVDKEAFFELVEAEKKFDIGTTLFNCFVEVDFFEIVLLATLVLGSVLGLKNDILVWTDGTEIFVGSILIFLQDNGLSGNNKESLGFLSEQGDEDIPVGSFLDFLVLDKVSGKDDEHFFLPIKAKGT